MADITLTASMRSNLQSLQSTQSLMDMTQERLSSGKKVNSAIDNPSSYYTAQSLNNRASDLSSLLDSMGQAVQTIKAANQGLETITKFAEQAKAVANTAMDSSDLKQVGASQKEFNSLLAQIDQLAGDAGYKGVNLLAGDDLTVTFNEVRSSTITVSGENADAASLGITEATDWDEASAATTAAGTALGTAKAYDINTDAVVAPLKTTLDAKTAAYTTAQATTITAQEALATAGGVVGDGSSEDLALTAAKAAETTALAARDTAKANYDVAAITAQKTKDDNVALAQKNYDTSVKADIQANKTNVLASIKNVETAINSLRSMASTFGNNYSIVQNRQDFTDGLISVLTEGADNLTLADMNEESANMLALQTRQQLAINSLSLASQASQAVLKLF